MRRHISGAVRSVTFLSILVFSLFCINQVLMPKYIIKNSTWPTTSSCHQFYEMENHSVDVLFLVPVLL